MVGSTVKFEKSIEIEAPLEKVFWYVFDRENAPKWHPSVKSAKRIEGKVGPDSVVQYDVETGGRRYDLTTHVLEWDLPKRYLDELRGSRLIKRYRHEDLRTHRGKRTRFIFRWISA